MAYAKLKQDGTFDHELPDDNIEWDATHFCHPSGLTPEEAATFRVVPVTEILHPAFDHLTQSCRRDGAELINGQWQYKWLVEDLATDVAQANTTRLLTAKIEALWQAANAYTSAYISGVAIGLLTLGVINNRPKALAVTQWSSVVWDAYYLRKALITTTSVDNLDFTIYGPMPYSVPELRAELGM
jgi:hypothetical protein